MRSLRAACQAQSHGARREPDTIRRRILPALSEESTAGLDLGKVCRTGQRPIWWGNSTTRRVAPAMKRVLTFFGRRFTPREYLGLHLTLGLLVSLLALAVFVLIAREVVGERELTALD